LGYLLPATVFTVHHILFIYHWVTPLPFCMAVVGLFVLALVLEKIYEKADSIVAPWLVHVFGDVAMMGIAVTMLWR
jgi:membrane protease YdiL (CAAX protease family)